MLKINISQIKTFFVVSIILFSLPVLEAELILYGVENAALHTIDTTTATPTFVVGGGAEDITSDLNTNTIYASNGSFLSVIDQNNPDPLIEIGPFGITGVRGIAFDTNTNTLYGADINTNSLYTINTNTGSATLVGALGVTNIRALAFDSNTNTLYGSHSPGRGPDNLITINTTTGAATTIGSIGSFPIVGLAFDPEANTLYGTLDKITLITINTTTGAGSTVGNYETATINDLAFLSVPEPSFYVILLVVLSALYCRQRISQLAV